MRTSVFVACFCLLFAPGAQSQDTATPPAPTSVSVESIELCTAVADREAVDPADAFDATVGQLYCLTRITGADDETTVTHVWYHGEQEMARVELPVRSPAWRTYSSKQILPAWTGAWRVDVVTVGGDVISTKAFRIRAATDGL